MKPRNLLLLIAAVVAITASGASFAHGGQRGGGWHHGARVGVFIGAPAFAYGGWGYRPYYPYYYPSYYYPPYYYPPAYVVPAPVVVQPAAPPVYIERSDEQAAAPGSSDYWYYCPDTKSYYPYVGSCASPWQRVAPRPQS